jgi:hypothetical protein
VEDLGAEPGHFRREAIRQLGDRVRSGHHARVGGLDAGDILHDPDLVGVEGGPDGGRAVITSATTEDRDPTLQRPAVEARHDGHLVGLQERQ